MISKSEIVAYFSAQTTGVHRYQTEEFLKLEAREKIFHIGAAERVLDFGCGPGDLLVYYAEHYSTVLGIDVSDVSVARARERLTRFGVKNTEVFCADEVTLWQHLSHQRFDVITSAAVMQYLDESQFRMLLRNARHHLGPGGRVIMFDIIDPRLYWIVKYGWFREGPFGLKYLAAGATQTLKTVVRKLMRSIAGKPEDYMGRSHFPGALRLIGEEEGYSTTFVGSMYYEYRYHALLQAKL